MNWIKTSLLIVILGIIYLSLRAPSESFQIRWNDKVGHVLAYIVLTINVGLLFDKKQWKWCALAVFLFSSLLEYLQGYVPGRSVEWADLLANGIGACIGLLILQVFYNTIMRLLKKAHLLKEK